MVLRGSAKVKSGFENFDMVAGDFLVIREMDSHSFAAADAKCEVLSLYFKMDDFSGAIPYLKYVYFACESFDLAEYKNEAQKLRQMIATIVGRLLAGDGVAKDMARDLLWILVSDYDLKNYYSRKWDAGYKKTEKYYKIMGYIVENYPRKNLQEYIAEQECYSKSYITHFFKEIGSSSFKDILDYVRVSMSEYLLLSTDLPINDISDRCGHSDVKYYIANFKKWFLFTPAEYRRLYLPEVQKASLLQPLQNSELQDRLEGFVRQPCGKSNHKSMVNPLSLKAFANSSSLSFTPAGISDLPELPMGGGQGYAAMVNVDTGDKGEISPDLSRIVAYYEDGGFVPVLALNCRGKSAAQARKLMEGCVELLGLKKTATLSFYIVYNGLGDSKEVSSLLEDGERILGYPKITPLFIP